jgi:CubicO group peptidase (beta-lactamase class C family)
VYRRGEEPVERRLRSDDRENLWSVSKTFVSVALGIAEAEGRLALDDPALAYYPELKKSAAPGLERVTLRQLLTMTSGSPHSWLADEPVEVPDLAADFFATTLAHEPGSYFSTWSQALRAPRSRPWSPKSYSNACRSNARKPRLMFARCLLGCPGTI